MVCFKHLAKPLTDPTGCQASQPRRSFYFLQSQTLSQLQGQMSSLNSCSHTSRSTTFCCNASRIYGQATPCSSAEDLPAAMVPSLPQGAHEALGDKKTKLGFPSPAISHSQDSVASSQHLENCLLTDFLSLPNKMSFPRFYDALGQQKYISKAKET